MPAMTSAPWKHGFFSLLIVILAPQFCAALTASELRGETAQSRSAPSSETPPRRARVINDSLRVLYVDLKDLPTEKRAGLLRESLSELEKFAPEIVKLQGAACGTVESRWLRDAEEQRAFAWVHGWATFSELVFRTSPSASKPDAREKTRLDLEASLDTLLRVYAQLTESSDSYRKCSDSAQEDLLRLRLPRAAWAEESLGYREPWTRRPTGSSGRYYIPSTTDILGRPDDRPALNDKKLVSLWGLVNHTLDASLARRPERDNDQSWPAVEELTAWSER